MAPPVGGDPAAFAIGVLLSPAMPPWTKLGGLPLAVDASAEAQTGQMRVAMPTGDAIAKTTGTNIFKL